MELHKPIHARHLYLLVHIGIRYRTYELVKILKGKSLLPFRLRLSLQNYDGIQEETIKVIWQTSPKWNECYGTILLHRPRSHGIYDGYREFTGIRNEISLKIDNNANTLTIDVTADINIHNPLEGPFTEYSDKSILP